MCNLRKTWEKGVRSASYHVFPVTTLFHGSAYHRVKATLQYDCSLPTNKNRVLLPFIFLISFLLGVKVLEVLK